MKIKKTHFKSVFLSHKKLKLKINKHANAHVRTINRPK